MAPSPLTLFDVRHPALIALLLAMLSLVTSGGQHRLTNSLPG
jgi:hypothetical protein